MDGTDASDNVKAKFLPIPVPKKLEVTIPTLLMMSLVEEPETWEGEL